MTHSHYLGMAGVSIHKLVYGPFLSWLIALMKSPAFFSMCAKFKPLKPFGIFLNVFAMYHNFVEQVAFLCCYYAGQKHFFILRLVQSGVVRPLPFWKGRCACSGIWQ